MDYSKLSNNGDGRYHMTEECDDGNYEDGDGCSSQCTEEQHYTCPKTDYLSAFCKYSPPPFTTFLDHLAAPGALGEAGSTQQKLQWFPQLTGVDGLLHVTNFKPQQHMNCPRQSGWLQMHLASSSSKHSLGGATLQNTNGNSAWEEALKLYNWTYKLDTMRLPGIYKMGVVILKSQQYTPLSCRHFYKLVRVTLNVAN